MTAPGLNIHEWVTMRMGSRMHCAFFLDFGLGHIERDASVNECFVQLSPSPEGYGPALSIHMSARAQSQCIHGRSGRFGLRRAGLRQCTLSELFENVDPAIAAHFLNNITMDHENTIWLEVLNDDERHILLLFLEKVEDHRFWLHGLNQICSIRTI